MSIFSHSGDNGKPIIVADPEADAAKVSVAAFSGNKAPTINVV